MSSARRARDGEEYHNTGRECEARRREDGFRVGQQPQESAWIAEDTLIEWKFEKSEAP